MNISEMLYVCTDNKLIHKVPEKFIDGFKHFRNFIHPGKEVRDENLQLDKSTLQLSINLVNWLIQNIKID